MSERNFMELLQGRWNQGKFVCVGLDPEASKIEELDQIIQLGDEPDSVLYKKIVGFNVAIVDATKHLACAYKPNSAFYEAIGPDGLMALLLTINYIHHIAPEVPVILDYKRGDIGNTNKGYVAAAKAADAVTIHPYLGLEAMRPFMDDPNKGAIVLCKTSNEGSGEFQDLIVGGNGLRLYQKVAANVASTWNDQGNCAVVVGATYTSELAIVRKIVGDMPILIPGIGAQGGDLEATVKAGADSNGQGMIVNNARGIIFASIGEDFAQAARDAIQKMHDDITAVLAVA